MTRIPIGNDSAGRGVRARELHYDSRLLRRRLVAASWIAGASIPLLAAAVFLVGCCVLPFHGVIHKLMPACEMAAHLLRGGHDDHAGEAQPSSPAREKQEPVKRMAAALSAGVQVPDSSHEQRPFFLSASALHRTFITLGALRCDQDVGLHVFVKTFLI